MISFKNNIKKSTLSFKVIVVCLLLSGSLISPAVAAPAPFCYTVVQPPVANVSNKVLADNVVTLTTDTDHGFRTNNSVTITGVGATFDGVYTITGVPEDNTFTYAKTAADVGSVASGGVASLGRILTDGFTCPGSLEIDNSVTSIAAEAFSTNILLTSVTIPNSVTSIGALAFAANTELTSVTIGNSVTSIGQGAFYLNTKLTSVTIPDSVISIGNSAFQNNTALTSVIIGNSVTSIGSDAFSGNILLTSVTIPDSVISIGNSAFESNRALTSVTIGNFVTSIGASAFLQNSALTSIAIPDSVTSIGNYAFYANTALTSVIINNSVTSIGESAFRDNRALRSVDFGNSVTTIGVDAFYGNTALTSVTIPDSVTSIGNLAFSVNTALTSLIIGNSVRNIGVDAFSHNPALTSVRFLGDAPAVGTNGFLDVAADATANVGYNATGFSEDGVDWEGLTVDVGSNQYGASWQKVEGALTADDAKGKRLFDSGSERWVDTYELVDVPADALEVSIYVKSNSTGTGLCDPALVIYNVNDADPESFVERAYDEGFGGEDSYDGNTCGKSPAEYYDAFLTEPIADEIVSNFRFQVTAQGLVGVLDEYNSGAYTLYVSVGRAELISAPAGDSGSDSSPTTKTITPVAVKNADSITNMKNKTYISKYSMKTKLRENNLFKYSASDSFKYQVFKSSKKSCGMRGNYVMRYENSKTCDLYITRVNAKGISNKYWVKINYLN